MHRANNKPSQTTPPCPALHASVKVAKNAFTVTSNTGSASALVVESPDATAPKAVNGGKAAEVQYHRFHFKPALMDATHRHIKTPPGPTPPGGWIVGSSVENIVPWPPFGGGRAVVAPAVAGQANLSNSSQMPRPTAPIPRAVAVPSAPKGLSGSVSAINQALSNNTSRLWESPVHSSRALAVQSATKRLPSSVFKANQTIVNNASQIQGPEPPSSRSIAVLSTPRALLGSVPATLAAGSSQGQIPKLRGGQVPSRDTALASWGLPGSQGLSKVIEPGRSAAQPHSLAALQPQLDGSTVSITPKDVVVTVDANGVHVQNITTMTFASMEHAAEYFNAQARLCGQWATQALLFSSSKLGNNSNQPSERVVPQPSTIGKQKQVESSPLAGADNRTDLTRKKTPRMLAGATASPLTHTHTANFVTSISSPPPQILFSEPTSSAQLLLNQPSLISPRERQGIPTALELDYDHPSQDKCTTTNPFLGEFGCASGIESYRPLHSSGLSTEVDSYRPSHSSAHLTDLDSYRPSDFSSRSTEGDTNRPFLPQSRAAVDASPRKADSAPIINPRAAVSEFILAARGSSSPDASLLMLPPLPSPAYAESVLPLTLERKDRRIVGVDAAANSEEIRAAYWLREFQYEIERAQALDLEGRAMAALKLSRLKQALDRLDPFVEEEGEDEVGKGNRCDERGEDGDAESAGVDGEVMEAKKYEDEEGKGFPPPWSAEWMEHERKVLSLIEYGETVPMPEGVRRMTWW